MALKLNHCIWTDSLIEDIFMNSSALKLHIKIMEDSFGNLPNAVLAGVASFLIQNDTQDKTTVRMQGMYVWMVK